MRIIAGRHRSRIIKTLEGMNTRPMMDSMREAVFNTIGPYFEDEVVLDLFGGSGALSLEAISRGAKEATIIDISRDAIRIITENVAVLHEEERVHIIQASYLDALKRLGGESYDLIFLDPPYRMNINNEIIDILVAQNMIKPNGIIVCQYVRGNMEMPFGFRVLKNYHHGSGELAILQLLVTD